MRRSGRVQASSVSIPVNAAMVRKAERKASAISACTIAWRAGVSVAIASGPCSMMAPSMRAVSASLPARIANKIAATRAVPKAAQRETGLPDWLYHPAPAEERPPRPLAPSLPAEDDSADPPPGPAQRAAAVVKATTFFDDPDEIAKASRGLGEAMVGINVDEIPQPHRLAERGW